MAAKEAVSQVTLQKEVLEDEKSSLAAALSKVPALSQAGGMETSPPVSWRQSPCDPVSGSRTLIDRKLAVKTCSSFFQPKESMELISLSRAKQKGRSHSFISGNMFVSLNKQIRGSDELNNRTGIFSVIWRKEKLILTVLLFFGFFAFGVQKITCFLYLYIHCLPKKIVATL